MIRIALKSLWKRPMRSFLTITGVVFGVGAVVAMLSIEEGTRREVMERIAAMGVHNILLKSVAPSRAQGELVSYGITDQDVRYIAHSFDRVAAMVPLWRVDQEVSFQGRSTDIHVYGTASSLPDVTGQRLIEGRFLVQEDERAFKSVCVLTRHASRQLRLFGNVTGADVRVGSLWFRVVGILEGDESELYLPLASARAAFGMTRPSGSSSPREIVEVDQLSVRMAETGDVPRAAERFQAYFSAKGKAEEVGMTVPLQLLDQEQAIQRTFQIAMGSIAGIALLVGGIGIMNIMLANVTERTKEVGTRRALGATQWDIMKQFLIEAVVLTMIGAVLGLAFGVGVAKGVADFMGRPLVYSPLSFIIPFSAAVVVGLVSGTYPAYYAARLDPIRALRSE